MLGVRRRRDFGSLLLLLTVLEHPTGAVGGLNCDFESGTLCTWKNTGTEEWTVQPGTDGEPPETGPALDHTTNTSAGPSMSSILSLQSSFLGHFLLASPNGDPIVKEREWDKSFVEERRRPGDDLERGEGELAR